MKYLKLNNKQRIGLGVALVCVIVLISFAVSYISALQQLNNGDDDQTFETPSVKDVSGVPLNENRGIYASDDDGSLKYIYVTVLPDDNNQDEYGTLANTENYNMFSTGEKPKSQVIFQEGSEIGPKNLVSGISGQKSNAVIEVRGKSTTNTSVKSYKITLSDDAGLWQGQKVLNLNKHPYDMTRMRNKLSFDYFEEIPNMASLRTQFVQLYIKDLSKNPNADYVSYGLFTQIEQVNKRYLRMHGFDDAGNLYKASNFEFYRYEDIIKLKEEPTYDENIFNRTLEIKGSDDHTALIQMLKDVNDINIDINTVIEKHFNRDNYITWLACNIVFGNMDTISQNYYIYKPLNSRTWYFLPWDYDGSWGGRDQTEAAAARYAEWENGLTNMWGNNLHRRFLKSEDNRKELDQKIQEILKIASEEETRRRLKVYYPVVSKLVSQNPDLNNLRTDMDGFAREVERVTQMPQRYYDLYKASIDKPMPFFLWDQEHVGNESIFTWEPSYDFQKDTLTYEFILSQSPSMTNPIYRLKDLQKSEARVPKLGKGMYYWKVIVKDSKGHTMISFDKYVSPADEEYYGVRAFEVK